MAQKRYPPSIQRHLRRGTVFYVLYSGDDFSIRAYHENSQSQDIVDTLSKRAIAKNKVDVTSSVADLAFPATDAADGALWSEVSTLVLSNPLSPSKESEHISNQSF
jgi:hypothetical protein